jgi:hypothetical protein
MKILYEHTTIAPERTKADIDKLLGEHGIQGIQWTTYQGQSILRFLWQLTVKGVKKEIMFEFKPPLIETQKRVWSQQDNRTIKATVQLEATSYRLLFWYLKNKLEAVKYGLQSMEKEFLSQAVVSLPNGSKTTVGENILDVLETMRTPALMAPERSMEKSQAKEI